MIKLARELSKPFPFIRVDFYNFGNEIHIWRNDIFSWRRFAPIGTGGK